MKRPKRPTRLQKIEISNNSLNPENWRIEKDDGSYLYLLSKSGKQRRIVSKYANKRNRKKQKEREQE